MSSHQEDIKSRILRDYRCHLATRGFKSGTDFTPEERQEYRTWDGVPGHMFIDEFMLRYRDYVDYYVEIHEIAEDDIGTCYKIKP